MVKVLVTGGCGFIGSHLVKKLVTDGVEVTVVDDLSSGSLNNLIEKLVRPRPVIPSLIDKLMEQAIFDVGEVVVITGDFADPEVLAHIREGEYTHIFHLAANPRVEYSVQNPTVTTDTNLFKTVALAELASQCEIKKFIFASSSAVYGAGVISPSDWSTEETNTKDPTSPHGLQKLCSEMFLQQFAELYGLKSVALRFFNVYGPGCWGDSPYATAVAAWCDKLKRQLPLRSDGDGEQTRDMVYIDDVISALVSTALRDTGKFSVYNVGTGTSVSNNQVLDLIIDRFGDVPIEHAPERPGDVKHTKASIKDITENTGWEPQFDFETGLDRTLAWWGLNGN